MEAVVSVSVMNGRALLMLSKNGLFPTDMQKT
jgi:hypothetical protein